jgi:xanthine dehydrogenase YagT iron-sulfur-binding subunit
MRQDDDQEYTGQAGRYSRRGFIRFVGVGAGMVGASLAGARFVVPPPAEAGQGVLAAAEMVKVRLNVNGRNHDVLVEPRWSLLYVLREIIGLTGTKIGCDRGECGACTVLIDDLPRYGCMTLAAEAENRRIVTVEGLMEGESLGPVQQAFLETDAYQCGYCTPGQIMAVEGLLRHNPQPSFEEIRQGCAGNLCRCGAYNNIFKAAGKAASRRG